jgi:hypothetical protein
MLAGIAEAEARLQAALREAQKPLPPIAASPALPAPSARTAPKATDATTAREMPQARAAPKASSTPSAVEMVTPKQVRIWLTLRLRAGGKTAIEAEDAVAAMTHEQALREANLRRVQMGIRPYAFLGAKAAP